jgi:signal transduction histidine kinase
MDSDDSPVKSVSDVLSKLKEIASAVMYAAEGSSEEEVLERIAKVCRELVGARYAALGVPDGKGGLRHFKVSGMTDEEIRRVAHLPVGRGLLGAIIRERQILRLVNMADDPRRVGFPEGHPPMKSLLGVPIQVGAQLFGILYLTDREDEQPFDEADEWLVETMAGYAALAIAGAQLSQQQTRLGMLEERERIGMELHDGVIQSLYAVGMQLDLMRGSGTMRPDEMSRIISNLNLVIEDIRRYILDLKLSRARSIHDCFRDILNRLYIPQHMTVEINAPDEPPPFASATFDAICQIANEAISNAVRHSEASRVTITTQQDASRFQITIVDDGIGFDSAAALDHDGLGLHNMAQRARLYGGQVTIDSTPGQGTSLTITIPVKSFQ